MNSTPLLYIGVAAPLVEAASDRGVFSFRTGALVNEDRIRATITAWLGTPPTRLTTHLEPISALDHQRSLAELHAALSGLPVRIITRIGLTLQQFQRDLATHCPAMVLLDCHGTQEGCLVFEDGRACADVVSAGVFSRRYL